MNISTRTLRYYEQIGLIESVKKEDYAYRTYDEAAVIPAATNSCAAQAADTSQADCSYS